MRAKTLVTGFALLSGVPAVAQLEQPVTAPSASAPLPSGRWLPTPLLPKLTDELIRDAVRETLAEPVAYPRRHEVDTIRGNSYSAFSQEFSQARVPDCLHSDGLKRQTTLIFGGILALPFIAVAKLRGVCN